MRTLDIILYLLALICFIVAAIFGDRVPPRVGLVALGLAFWVAVPFTALVLG